MVSTQIWKILTWPIRRLGRLLRSGARDTKIASETTAKTGGAVIAKTAAVDLLENEYREETPSGIEAALFTQLPRPRLTEKAASDLTLEQAERYASDAKDFYRYDFSLFARGDFFYEEVEEDYLNDALGFGRDSIDKRFLDVTRLFRRTLNGNTRRMLVYWMPIIFILTFAPAIYAVSVGLDTSILSFDETSKREAALFGVAALSGALLAFLFYSWPFKVVQQRNLMNLDNYVTSKFARINNNFQVAKRRALNVERDKRMSQRDELKSEAGSWTLAYHWFAMRLFLCEMALRNKFYQLRRNTTLYWTGGLFIIAAVSVAVIYVMHVHDASNSAILSFAGASLLYLIIAGSIMRRTTGMMFHVLESNEWSRFHLMDLDETIRDHVGEDKLQIVTFRDRNRFE